MGVSSKWCIQAVQRSTCSMSVSEHTVSYSSWTLSYIKSGHQHLKLVPLKLTSVASPLETHDWLWSVLIASMTWERAPCNESNNHVDEDVQIHQSPALANARIMSVRGGAFTLNRPVTWEWASERDTVVRGSWEHVGKPFGSHGGQNNLFLESIGSL